MKQSNQNTTNTPSLETLISDAPAQLITIHYSQRSLRRYRTVWQHFVEFI